MRILFNLFTTIEIPDADNFPPREDVETALVNLFEDEGMIAHGLEVTNYAVPFDDENEQDDGR